MGEIWRIKRPKSPVLWYQKEGCRGGCRRRDGLDTAGWGAAESVSKSANVNAKDKAGVVCPAGLTPGAVGLINGEQLGRSLVVGGNSSIHRTLEKPGTTRIRGWAGLQAWFLAGCARGKARLTNLEWLQSSLPMYERLKRNSSLTLSSLTSFQTVTVARTCPPSFCRGARRGDFSVCRQRWRLGFWLLWARGSRVGKTDDVTWPCTESVGG